MALNSLFCADVPLSNYSLTHSPAEIQIESRMCCTEVNSWRGYSSRVKVGGWTTIKEREIRFEEKVLYHLPSRAAFVGAPLLTVGIEISQKQNRRRELTDKGLQFSDAVQGERYMEHTVIVLWHIALSAMAYRPVLMCSCWWGVVLLTSIATPPWREPLFSKAGIP